MMLLVIGLSSKKIEVGVFLLKYQKLKELDNPTSTAAYWDLVFIPKTTGSSYCK